jgi:hypothetical protein
MKGSLQRPACLDLGEDRFPTPQTPPWWRGNRSSPTRSNLFFQFVPVASAAHPEPALSGSGNCDSCSRREGVLPYFFPRGGTGLRAERMDFPPTGAVQEKKASVPGAWVQLGGVHDRKPTPVLFRPRAGVILYGCFVREKARPRGVRWFFPGSPENLFLRRKRYRDFIRASQSQKTRILVIQGRTGPLQLCRPGTGRDNAVGWDYQ